ncbi:MAG: PAS domain S-box protein [Pseudomonadota bacterium]
MTEAEFITLAVQQTRDYALFVLDPSGNVVTWNSGAEQIKGYTPDEIIGQHFSKFYTRESVESGWPAHELKVATIEGRFEDEGWRVRKDGSRFWASVVITAIRDQGGKLVGFSKVTRDLSERKKHEEALAHSEERFRLLVEGVADYAIFLLDPLGIVTSWNTGAQRIIGYEAEEIVGKHFSRFFTEEDLHEAKPWEELAVSREKGRFETEGWRVKRNQERFWARAIVTALYDTHGNLRGFAKVTQDLTDRKHIQALEAAARNVNEFIAVLAHEIRNPLAPIETAAQVLEMSLGDASKSRAMVQIIKRQSTHLRHLVNDMLDIARVTRGELPLERQVVNLSGIVRDATAATAADATCKHYRVELDLASEPLLVEADSSRLYQLFMNLLSNACKYTDPGGQVSVTTAAMNGFAQVTVKDTGRGIDPHAVNDIFAMFVQRSPVIERVGGGLGIGLALSRKIAELHGGTLSAASEGLGRGSVFTFRMPISASQPLAAPSAAGAFSPSETEPRIERILIVDDNVDAAATLNVLLNSLGYETSVAHTGAEALERVPEFKPDVVLLDIGLPGMDGYEVARRLRTLVQHRRLKIVAVTGWGQEADKQSSLEAGIDVHLVKPIDLDDIQTALGAQATVH